MVTDSAPRDSLTGVFSRDTLTGHLAQEIERSLRSNTELTLLIVDVDHFKTINDAFGYARGDQVLVEIVERLRKTLRAGDVVFRYAGDEFVVLLPNTPKEQAKSLAERLVLEVARLPVGESPPLSVGVSVGAACYPSDGASAEDLFGKADARLYKAKRTRRGTLVASDTIVEHVFGEITRLLERDHVTEMASNFLVNIGEHRGGDVCASWAAPFRSYEGASCNRYSGQSPRISGSLPILQAGSQNPAVRCPERRPARA